MRPIILLEAQLFDLAASICVTWVARYPRPLKKDVTSLETELTGIRRFQAGGVTSGQNGRDIRLALAAVTQLTRLHEEQIRIEPIAPARFILDHVIIG
jgi:hypothetical protein